MYCSRAAGGGGGGGVFFCQAEDGIRDLVRSRGLGDVYKRQGICREMKINCLRYCRKFDDFRNSIEAINPINLMVWHHIQVLISVSYTHLTLPTSDLV